MTDIIALLVGAVSMLTSAVVFPVALKFAKKQGIVDHPDSRKLQCVPVPVFGGIVVYSGILTGNLVLLTLMPNATLMWGLTAMTIMMGIGIWDDIKDISALLRFLIEILLVTGFMLITGVYIDNLHGLWGIHELTPAVGVPLSIFSGVGIINAINLIDGVDGYVSGYSILACACFAVAFGTASSLVWMCMALIVIGALLPFFLHNVFGVKSRMFIGDGGTLMLGMLMVVMSFYAISDRGELSIMEQDGLCIPAFLLAVGCIPLFDTFRVMTLRILRGGSPFRPDKTHLHHLFVDMGFSHLGTVMFILLVNVMVLLVWFLSWKAGLSPDGQMYTVFTLGLLVTFGFCKFMKVQQLSGRKGSKLWQAMCRLGRWTHRENKHSWTVIRDFMDGFMMGGVKLNDETDTADSK